MLQNTRRKQYLYVQICCVKIHNIWKGNHTVSLSVFAWIQSESLKKWKCCRSKRHVTQVLMILMQQLTRDSGNMCKSLQIMQNTFMDYVHSFSCKFCTNYSSQFSPLCIILWFIKNRKKVKLLKIVKFIIKFCKSYAEELKEYSLKVWIKIQERTYS